LEHVVYVFEGFQLDVTRRRLSSSGGVVLPLSARSMDSLLLLVANAGQTVDRRRLTETVWPGAVVEDHHLNQSILAIRRVLGEPGDSERYIRTVPGRGYCFACPVHMHTREYAGAELPTPLSFARRVALTVAAIAPVACLLAVGVMYVPAPVQDADVDAEPSLVLRLRGTHPVSPTALADCLAGEPDLQLEVSVQLVRKGAAGSLWSGQYVASQQDLLSLPAAGGGGCDALAAPRQAALAVDAAASAAAITSR